jgi:hypothetical protein
MPFAVKRAERWTHFAAPPGESRHQSNIAWSVAEAAHRMRGEKRVGSKYRGAGSHESGRDAGFRWRKALLAV